MVPAQSNLKLMFVGDLLILFYLAICHWHFTTFAYRMNCQVTFHSHLEILYPLHIMVHCSLLETKSLKTTSTLSRKSRNKCHSNRFWWCPLWNPCLYCYHFLLLLYMNQVPEEWYLGSLIVILIWRPSNALSPNPW